MTEDWQRTFPRTPEQTQMAALDFAEGRLQEIFRRGDRHLPPAARARLNEAWQAILAEKRLLLRKQKGGEA